MLSARRIAVVLAPAAAVLVAGRDLLGPEPVVAAVGVLIALWPHRPALVARAQVPLERKHREAILRRRPEPASHVISPIEVAADAANWRARSRDEPATSAIGHPVTGVADQLAVAMSAGASIHEAVRVAGRHSDSALGWVCGQLDVGRGLIEVLEELETTARMAASPGWSALASLLASGVQTGAPLAESLGRLAASERLRRRRLIEIRIRRLPVLLLLPTALGVLPAFMVMTIVPLLIHSAQNLT